MSSVADDPGLDDMRVFDPSALTYVLINAVKELAARVEHLEQALAAATAAAELRTSDRVRLTGHHERAGHHLERAPCTDQHGLLRPARERDGVDPQVGG